MDPVLEFLNKNPWLNLVFLTLAILSIVVSIVTFYRSKKEKIPVYYKKSVNLIVDRLNKISAIKITYNDQRVKNLTLTRISIWNKGRDTIERTDVAPSDLLRIEAKEEYQILQANIIYTRTRANNFSLRPNEDKKAVFIDFDYFHTDEGIVIELYHTGTSGDHIELKGTIKGVNRINPGIGEDETAMNFLTNLIRGMLLPLKRYTFIHAVTTVLLVISLLPIAICAAIIDSFLDTFRHSPFNQPPKEFRLELTDSE